MERNNKMNYDELYLSSDQQCAKAPLTDSQMGIYLQCMRRPQSTMYNNYFYSSCSRPAGISAETVRNTVNRVFALHPALYAHLEQGEEGVLMVRSPMPAEGICRVDEGGEAEVQSLLNRLPACFDLMNDSLSRVQLILTKDSIHMFLNSHHLVSDGTTLALITRQFFDAIAGVEPQPETIDPFSLAESEKKILQSEAGSAAADWFRQLLGGVEVDSTILYDHTPAADSPVPMKSYEVLLEGIDPAECVKGTGITKGSFFLGVYAYTLAKMTGQTEALFTSGESGRKRSALLNGTAAMMVRTIPIYAKLDENQTGLQLTAELQQQFRTSIENDCTPFTELAQQYGVSADNAFIYQSDLLSGFESAAGHIRYKMLDNGYTFGNTSTHLMKNANGYILRVEYRSDAYEEATIERFCKLYAAVAKAFIAGIPLKEIVLLNEIDRAFLDGLNRERLIPYDASETFLDLFRRSAVSFPEKTAVIFKNERFTYAQLDALSDKIAAYIHGLGIGTGDAVPLLIQRCPWMVSLSLGVMKAGAMYEPLDPTYPEERLSFMVKDAEAKLLIADRALLPMIKDYDGPVLCIDEINALPEGHPENQPPRPQDPFIILYTSGTTGTPKGCRLCHGNLRAFLTADAALRELGPDCVVTQYAGFGFDAHMSDIYPALAKGGEIHIIPNEMRLDLPALKAYFEANGLTHVFMTTQVARQFAAEFQDVKGLRYLLCGGEKLGSFNPPSYRVVNAYGPTESTLYTVSFPVDRLYEDIPIGKVMPNQRAYIVDSLGRRVPPGVPGELVVCGPQVGMGYYHREEKTAEVFVPNTYEENPGDRYLRCYRTGDIVRFLPDGNIIFIGRRDMQVKIRGFRIELSEVEQVIREYPGMKEAAVVAREEGGGKVMHAYIVADAPIDIADLERFIKERKPAYMVPAAMMQIEAIPLTPNMKVDKRKLPPIVKSAARRDSGPRVLTELEKKLSALLAEVLGHSDFEVDTAFSDAGLTSISSIRWSVRLLKDFGIKFSTAELLDKCSILDVENRIVRGLLEKTAEDTAVEKQPQQPKKLPISIPLTQSQVGVYTDCLMNGSEAYNIPMLLKLPAQVSEEKLKAAIVTAVHAHPSLLCTVHTDMAGDPAVYPHPDLPVDITTEALESLPPQSTQFSFVDQPLFRFRILHCAGERYLLIEIHHIIFDGESMTILLHDIDRAYRGERLTPEEFRSFDLALEEQSARKGEAFSEAKAYYDSVFRGVSADYLPCPNRSGENQRAELNYPLSLAPETVSEFCKRMKITENIFFNGAFALLLSRYTAHEDALYTTIYNGRSDPRTESLAGMLVKTLPVYLQAGDDIAVEAFFRALDEQLRLLKKHELYSFADAAHDYGVKADVMFIYQGAMLAESRLDGQVLEPVPMANAAAKEELAFEVFLSSRGYRLNVEYNGGHYSPEWVETFADAFDKCLKEMIAKTTLGEVDITSERALAAFDVFNDTAWNVPVRPAYRLLEESADRFPECAAVIDSSKSWSYRQLDNMANVLAQQLIDGGVQPGSVVEIIMNRGAEVYLAEQAILKAGSAFLFLSPTYPDERIRFVSEDCQCRAIITTHEAVESRKEFFDELKLPLFFADEIPADAAAPRLSLAVDPRARAYLIYTSGSTGKPKGVVIGQQNLVNLVSSNPKNPEVTAHFEMGQVFAAVTAFTFDASVFDAFGPIANGKTIYIASDEEIHNPAIFTENCLKYHAAGMIATPSFVLSCLDYPGFADVIRQMKSITCGGEVFPVGLYKKLRELNPEMHIINAYGPSEATVGCTCKLLNDPENITIGTPQVNMKLFVIDRKHHILPKGALGELVVTGAGVGLGYLNRPDLTEKVFFRLQGEPAYRTGDLAVIRHDDEIEFHGRLDNQVKLRGLRVELGEIESAMASFPEVKTAVVKVFGDEKNRYLAGYYTAERQVSPEELTAHISKTLAEYMVPRVMMQLETMPQTANGKIDRRALPEPVLQAKAREYVEPANETEKQLCEAFAQTLGIEKVGVTDDFFELGGTSLSATKVAMFAMSHGIPVVYSDIFKHPTVRELAALKAVSEQETSEHWDAGDFTAAHSVLAGNVWTKGEYAERQPLGDLLLTGATGFLGIHILRHYLETESGKVYCLLRKGTLKSAEQKLKNMYFYYFEQSLDDLLGKRIFCIDGDITDADKVAALRDVPFRTLVNCAALVKHFVKDDALDRVNVDGVANLVRLCQETNRRLIHISTVSVAGEGVDGTPAGDKVIHENELYFRQVLENAYVVSKFRSERLVLEAAAQGLDAKIMRVGNLMPRWSDGEFQINFLTNGFMRRLRGYHALGCIPYSVLTAEMEFSPIDETAAAILLLSGTERKYTLFHVNNSHKVNMGDVVRAMNSAGLKVEMVRDEVFIERLREAMSNPELNDAAGGLIAYLNRDVETRRYMLGYDNRFTNEVLFTLGYSWNLTDNEYVSHALSLLRETGFFDLNRGE